VQLKNNSIREELQRMVDTFQDSMDVMKEFLFFLELCPQMLRQPYNTYLPMEKCMFGRQVERQWVLKLLPHPDATSDLTVHRIVGLM
jgi:hypothetical protein